jgi:hypothetical protein
MRHFTRHFTPFFTTVISGRIDLRKAARLHY